MMPIRTTALLALALALTAASTARATKLTIINSCSESIDLWDNRAVQVMGSGERITRDLPVGYLGMFRAGTNPQATLAEFSVDGNMQMIWYDISIIPTGPKSGPDYCPSLQACKDYTGGVGFNKPMQIAAAGCKTRTCMADGCADAYQYPKDDLKTTACNINTPVELTFCPGGSGGQAPVTQAPTPPPTTQAPTPPPTTQAPTPPPTTQAPTPPPTTQAPTPPPTTQAPTPEPTTKAPTPEPTTQAPTPEPTTQAPTPVPTTQAPTPEPTVDPTLLKLLGVHGDGSSSGSHSSAASGSSNKSEDTALEAGIVTQAPTNTDSTVASVVLNPIRTDSPTTGGDATNAGGNSQNVSVQSTAEPSSKLGMTLLIVLGAVASVAGVAVFVAAKKKKQMDESETKDSLYCEEGMLTPVNDIQCI